MNIIGGAIYFLACAITLIILSKFIGTGIIWWIVLTVLAVGATWIVMLPPLAF